jgi:hypothetical protein
MSKYTPENEIEIKEKEPILALDKITFDQLVQEITGVSAKDFYDEFYNVEGKNG